ncbi:MAG: SWIM zinc finger family protein [Chroococcidiopsidaceae cyanobacterium CP_BM_ER_R8_30]|nr:SWIM zinc finger family protein [Chroococcidiopsidaceae cyanobacterium CP_BM_ER_R8_30]
MAQFSRTWWGQRFIAALEKIMDSGRLSRGRSYARGGKVKSFEIEDGLIKAQVRGSVNPYFGVYKEPLYIATIEFKSISAANWSAAIAYVASKASLISRLMLKEMPDTIEDAFAKLDLHLLPHSKADFKTSCSCPDWSNPCKHIAGVYYLLAAQLDQDPFLLFELRGLSRESLQKELAKSPLGQALSAELALEKTAPDPDSTYYTRPTLQSSVAVASLKDFWHGTKRLPQVIEAASQTSVPAILVKKQGDFPPFWSKESSFIETMEELYGRIRNKNTSLF